MCDGATPAQSSRRLAASEPEEQEACSWECSGLLGGKQLERGTLTATLTPTPRGSVLFYK